jgi:transglutaminase-like putative cysteine protease
LRHLLEIQQKFNLSKIIAQFSYYLILNLFKRKNLIQICEIQLILLGRLLKIMELELSIENYLKPTEYCNFNHPDIIARVEELTKVDKTPEDKALSIFHFVRDKIKFMMVIDDDKASDTLIKRYGDCGTKTNLQVALLRAANIPARYHVASLHKECIKGIVSKVFYLLSPKIIPHHPWCECYLNEKWISCDTLLDKALVEVLYKKGIFTKKEIQTIDWDGKNDLNTMLTWMIEDKGTYASLDEIISEAEEDSKNYPEKLVRYIVNKSNNRTDKLRKK